MTFWPEFKNSVYNPEFYRRLINRPFRQTVKYYGQLSLIIALLFTLMFGLVVVPKLLNFLWQGGESLSKNYPPDLVLNIVNGEVRINQPTPYTVDMPVELKSKLPTELQSANLIIIDPATSTPNNWFIASSTLFVLGQRDLLLQSLNGKVERESVPQDIITSISATDVQDFVAKISPWYKVIALILVILVFGATLVSMVLMLGLLLIQAIFSWLLLMIMKLKNETGQTVSFLTAFKLTLHATSLPLVLIVILVLLGLPITSLLFFTLILVILYFNLCPCLHGK